jgi:hypothetical protein
LVTVSPTAEQASERKTAAMKGKTVGFTVSVAKCRVKFLLARDWRSGTGLGVYITAALTATPLFLRSLSAIAELPKMTVGQAQFFQNGAKSGFCRIDFVQISGSLS